MRTVILLYLSLCSLFAQQVVNQPSVILAGNPPGGIGAACSSPPIMGFLDSTGAAITCSGGVWTVIGSGGGSVSSVHIAGTTSQITASGTCTITTSGTCTLSFPSGGITLPNSSALGTPLSVTLTNGTGLPLSTGVTGNLSVANLNNGTGAAAGTFWRGDGSWATPSLASAGASLVNSATNINSAATDSITVSYTPTTGNTVIVVGTFMAFSSGVPTAATVTDGGTNTYTQDDVYSATANLGTTRYPGYYVFRKSNVTGGAFTYTFTVTPPSAETYVMGVYVLEFSNIALSSPVDGTPVHATNSTGTTGADSGALTTTNATDVLLGVYVLPSSAANGLCVPTGEAVLVTADSNTANVPSGVSVRSVSTVGSRHASCVFTSGSTTRWIAGQLAYKLQ